MTHIVIQIHGPSLLSISVSDPDAINFGRRPLLHNLVGQTSSRSCSFISSSVRWNFRYSAISVQFNPLMRYELSSNFCSMTFAHSLISSDGYRASTSKLQTTHYLSTSPLFTSAIWAIRSSVELHCVLLGGIRSTSSLDNMYDVLLVEQSVAPQRGLVFVIIII